MLSHFTSTHLRNFIITNNNKVCSLITIIFPIKFYNISTPLTNSASYSTSSIETNNTHLKYSPVIDFNVGKLVYSKYVSQLNHKVYTFNTGSASLIELLLRISHVSPEITRKYLRVCSWEPVHVLDLLLGFDLGCRNSGFDVGIVQCLWEIFRRVGDGNEGFKHLPKSCEVMASMLVNVGMFREVETLLSAAESRGISLASDEIFSDLIEGFVRVGELERGLLMYKQMKERCLTPSLSCHLSLIDVLVKDRKSDCAFRIYEDMVELGVEFGDVETGKVYSLITLLCRDGKINDARKLLRKIVSIGWKPISAILSEVANVYYEKKDFDDLLSFFVEMKSAPGILVGNKIVNSVCNCFGIDRAESFLWELEQLGFRPNEMTLGIFICFCCRAGNLRDAFYYLSEILSRGLKPDRYSYNALISGLFKVGMKEHVLDIFYEMIDNGTKPNAATLRVLLAGFCKARRFGEVKFLIRELADHGSISLSPSEDPISKAFSVLGLDPLTVKVKRDNDIKNLRSEFVDELGNGLYLDTNLDEFEKSVTGVLEESLVPDFDFLVKMQCDLKNVKRALLLVDDMLGRGQDLSLPVLSLLIKQLCESNSQVKAFPSLIDRMYQPLSKLDHETLNLLIQSLSQKGFADRCMPLLDEMHRQRLPINNVTYTCILLGLHKLGSLADVLYCWDLARKSNWLPELRDFGTVLDCLCQRGMHNEILELFDIMMSSDPNSGKQICDVFFQTVCSAGFTGMGHILINELRQKNYPFDHAVYSHLITGYCMEKRFSEALMVLDTHLADNLVLTSDAICLVIPELCKANRFETAVTLKDAGLRDYPSISVPIYSALIRGYCRNGLASETYHLFLEMFSRNIHPNDEIYNALLQGNCTSSDLKAAKELLSGMIRRRITLSVSSYRELLRLLCRKGMFHSAGKLKRLMLSESSITCSILYNFLIFHLFQAGKHILVDELLNELEGTGVVLDEVGYNFLVHGFSVCERLQRSNEYMNDMIAKGLRPCKRSLRAVICNLCSNGELQKALELSTQIDLRGWSYCSTVHYVLLDGLFADGRILEAEMFVAQALEKGTLSDTIYFDSLIRKFCQYGKLETAVNLLNRILKRSIPNSSSYECIVQSFCVDNNLDRAMDFLVEMLHRNLKPSLETWESLIDKFCKYGKTSEAERLLSSMVETGETPSKRMYLSLIDRYRSENNLSKVSTLLDRMQQHGYEPEFVTQWSLISGLSISSNQRGKSQGFLSRLLGGSVFSGDDRGKSKQG